MPCIEHPRVRRHRPARLAAWATLLGAVALLAGCGQPPRPAPPAPPATVAPPAGPNTPARPAPSPTPGPAAPLARNWDDYRLQAARRLVQANRERSFDGPVPEPLLAIPVLEVELKADGSVHRIHVVRRPSQALDTVDLAVAAVHRAAPFGPVGHLPKPWVFSETFLFDDERRFKPRTLDR